MWDKETIHETVERQRAFFGSGATLDVDGRIRQLKKLKRAVLAHRGELERALQQDLGRSSLHRWAKPETHFSGLHCFPSLVTKVYKMPYGVTLIVSPYNFPILLSLGVLTASIAGGNTAVIKASSKSPACTAALQKLTAECFPPEYVTVVDGGHEVADLCLSERFDKIFYTGSPRIGAHVLEKAAPKLTPVALELGGETGNWCIIRADADLRDAARKIAFFKALNSGQICININQVAVAQEIAEDFVRELKLAFERQLGPDPLHNPEYPRLITKAAWQKCADTAARYRETGTRRSCSASSLTPCCRWSRTRTGKSKKCSTPSQAGSTALPSISLRRTSDGQSASCSASSTAAAASTRCACI